MSKRCRWDCPYQQKNVHLDTLKAADVGGDGVRVRLAG